MNTQTGHRDRGPDEQGAARPCDPTRSHARSAGVADLPVRAVMSTHVLVTTPDDDVFLAWELMAQAGIRHLPVVDGTRLVGVIDDRRLAGACAFGPFAPRRVHDLVDHPPLRVREDVPLRDVAARMVADRADVVCVTTPTGDLLGIVTTSDLVHALAGKLPTRPQTATATAIPSLFRFAPVFPSPGSAPVTDGPAAPRG